jgi:hypothetical protein
MTSDELLALWRRCGIRRILEGDPARYAEDNLRMDFDEAAAWGAAALASWLARGEIAPLDEGCVARWYEVL